VLEISTQLGESVFSQLMEDGVVCPAILQKGLFTTSAVDNIDHNHSATTATLHWLNLQIEATQDEVFERDSLDQTCSLVFVGSVNLVLISRMLVLHLCMFREDS
jgi:hypothetical protein